MDTSINFAKYYRLLPWTNTTANVCCQTNHPDGRFEPWPIETDLCARSGATSDQVDTHANAKSISNDLGMNAKKHISIQHTNIQLSTQMHVIEHANAYHLARDRISIEYANAKNSN